jgi:hypothetical protein
LCLYRCCFVSHLCLYRCCFVSHLYFYRCCFVWPLYWYCCFVEYLQLLFCIYIGTLDRRQLLCLPHKEVIILFPNPMRLQFFVVTRYRFNTHNLNIIILLCLRIMLDENALIWLKIFI